MAFLDVFGFTPDTASCQTARPAEERIVKLKLLGLASTWGEIHDEITRLREKYKGDSCGVPMEEALVDQKKLVEFDRARQDAVHTFFQAFELANKESFKLGEQNIDQWYEKVKQQKS